MTTASTYSPTHGGYPGTVPADPSRMVDCPICKGVGEVPTNRPIDPACQEFRECWNCLGDCEVPASRPFLHR